MKPHQLGFLLLSCLTACVETYPAPEAETRSGDSARPALDSAAEPDPSPDPADDRGPPVRCVPSAADARRMTGLLAATDTSVHEIVVCGGAQMRLVESLLPLIFTSNARFFSGETLAALGLDRTADADRVGDFRAVPGGAWRVQMGTGDESHYDVVFHRAGTEDALRTSVFDLESYLEGARVETSMSFQEMMDAPERPNTYTLTWKRLGPLADVLFPAGAPWARRVVLSLSLDDLILMYFGGEARGLGPFHNLADLAVDARAQVLDVRGRATVRYLALAERVRLGDLLSNGRIGFRFTELSATEGRTTLTGEAGAVTYVEGGLAGVLRMTLRNSSGTAVAIGDFAEGNAYPEWTWACPDVL